MLWNETWTQVLSPWFMVLSPTEIATRGLSRAWAARGCGDTTTASRASSMTQRPISEPIRNSFRQCSAFVSLLCSFKTHLFLAANAKMPHDPQ